MKNAHTSNEKFHQEPPDGSKMGEAVGYSIVNENQTFGKRIDEMCPVYTAEARPDPE
jgi:hypothetical protein